MWRLKRRVSGVNALYDVMLSSFDHFLFRIFEESLLYPNILFVQYNTVNPVFSPAFL